MGPPKGGSPEGGCFYMGTDASINLLPLLQTGTHQADIMSTAWSHKTFSFIQLHPNDVYISHERVVFKTSRSGRQTSDVDQKQAKPPMIRMLAHSCMGSNLDVDQKQSKPTMVKMLVPSCIRNCFHRG